jgi:hypothetical protein
MPSRAVRTPSGHFFWKEVRAISVCVGKVWRIQMSKKRVPPRPSEVDDSEEFDIFEDDDAPEDIVSDDTFLLDAMFDGTDEEYEEVLKRIHSAGV